MATAKDKYQEFFYVLFFMSYLFITISNFVVKYLILDAIYP